VPRPHDFPARFGTQHQQQGSVHRTVEIHHSPGLGQPESHATLPQRGQDGLELTPVEGSLVLTDDDGVEWPIRVRGRLKSADAAGRSHHGNRREHTSKYSATITPSPAIVSSATCRCQRDDVSRSWYSSVDIRP
jgi:hypothetical protein